MERCRIGEGEVKLKGLILVCLLLLSLVGLPAVIRPASAEPATSPSREVDQSVVEYRLISPTIQVEKPAVDVISFVESFDEPKFDVKNNYDVIEIAGCSTTSSPGEPTIPVKTIFVLLPPDKDVLDIEVIPTRQVPVERELYLYPGQEPVPAEVIPSEGAPQEEQSIFQAEPEFTPPNLSIYSSRTPYPDEKHYELDFVTSYRGYKLAAIRLFPIKYIPAERSAVFYPALEVRVELKAAEPGLAFRPTSDVTEWVRTRVENPEDIDLYNSSPRSGGDAEYLIITRPMFQSALLPLVGLKSERMSVKILTVDDIVTHYQGGDIPEKIRNCIIDYYQNHGTKWVLLAGDADYYDLGPSPRVPYYFLDQPWEVPVRYVWNPTQTSEETATGVNWHYQPTDYYYAGLDGTWDADGDSRFGERASESIADEADWFADVYVGRIPARDEATMETIIDKTVARERNPQESIDICLFDADLNHSYGDGRALGRYIRDNCIPWSYNVHEYNEKDGTLNYASFKNAVNNYDPTLVNAAGHGGPDGIITLSSGIFVDMQTPGYITNKGFTMYAMSCSTNAFDIQGTCLGEAMLQDPNGGAVGYIGGTRLMWYASCQQFLKVGAPVQDVMFFEEIFQNREVHQGAALYKSKMNCINSWGDVNIEVTVDRANLFVTMLLGDPELSILTLENMLVSPPDNVFTLDNTPTFEWMDIEDLTGVTYTLQYSTGQSFSGWMCRMPITINNIFPSQIGDYQILVTFDTASLIAQGKLNPDASDLRFRTSDGQELSYWIESGVGTESTRVWVLVPSIPVGEATIYVYYGNSDVTAGSSYDNTMQKIYSEEGDINGLWHFDEGTGTTTADSSGNGNNGILKNGVSWVSVDGGQWDSMPGVVFSTGAHLNFDGVNDYVRIPYSDSLDFTGEMTIMAWVKADTTPIHRGIVTKTSFSGDWPYGNEFPSWSLETGYSSATPVFHIDEDMAVEGTTTLAAGTWYNLAVTYDEEYDEEGNAKIYVNGILDGAANLDPSFNYLPDPLVIGANYYGEAIVNFFNGKIDEVSFWNRALTAGEIKAHYERRKYASPEPTTSVGAEELLGKTWTVDGLTETIYTVPDDEALAPGRYYWRVRAVDSAGNKNVWSEARQFTVFISPPTPDLISPEDGALIHDDTPTFRWSSDLWGVTYVTYTLQYSIDSSFETGVVTVDGITVNGDLDNDGDVDEDDYWVFVAAFGHSIGDPAYNPEADYDGTGCVGLVDYQIWLGHYRYFVENKITYTVPLDGALAEDIYYYWRVRTIDVGNVGEWSEGWQFTIDLNMVVHTTMADFESGTLENLSAFRDEVKLSPSIAWGRTYESLNANPAGIAVDSSSNVYITGTTRGTNKNWLTVKYDGDGNFLWAKVRDTGDAGGIAADTSGNVYVTGHSYDSEDDLDMCYTVKYNENGGIVWARPYTSYHHVADYGRGVAVDPSGYVYVVGDAYDDHGYASYFIIKYYENGDRIWDRNYLYYESQAIDIAVDSSGNVYVVALCDANYFVIKHNQNGNQVWVKYYGSGGDEAAVDIAADSSGNVYVTGNLGTIKYDENSNFEWSVDEDSFQAAGIAVDSSDHVYVTGTRFGSGLDYHTMKYDGNGNLLWEDIYDCESNVQAADVAVDSSGNIYVTGYYLGSCYHTIKYGYLYPPSGILTSTDLISSSKYIPSATATWNADVPEGTSLEVELSNDGGSAWYPVENGETIVFPELGHVLRYRLTLSAADNTRTPVLYDITLYSIIDNIPPPTPTLISPLNGAFMIDNTPTFRWTAVGDPSGVTYTLHYSTSMYLSSRRTTIENLRDNTYTLPDSWALRPGPYYWRVRATDGAGNVGGWSETWRFTVLRPSFSIRVKPDAGQCEPGGSTEAEVMVEAIGGFSGEVTLSYVLISTHSTEDVRVEFEPRSGKPTFTSRMTVTASRDAMGSYLILIKGTGGGQVQSCTYTLKVHDTTPSPTPTPISPLDRAGVGDETPILSDISDLSGATYTSNK